MSETWQVQSQFDRLAAVTDALELLCAEGVREYELFSPVPSHPETEARMPRRGSWVRFFSTFGGFAGLAAGLALCVVSSQAYGLITGGKPPVNLVPFVVVAFECTILFACLATAASLAYYARLKPLAPPEEYDGRFSDDRYGLYVSCDPAARSRVVELLLKAGAVEVVAEEGADG